jgi:hypothetical protein
MTVGDSRALRQVQPVLEYPELRRELDTWQEWFGRERVVI